MSHPKRSIQVKTLSFQYNPVQDRIKMIVNLEEAEGCSFWITRRFYISLLFQMETFLQRHGLEQTVKAEHESTTVSEDMAKRHRVVDKTDATLLQKVSFQYVAERKQCILRFGAVATEAVSVVNPENAYVLYRLLKEAYPKKEWGMV